MILIKELRKAAEKETKGNKVMCYAAVCYLAVREGYDEGYITDELKINHEDFVKLYSYSSYHVRDGGFVNMLNSIMTKCNYRYYGRVNKPIKIVESRRQLFKFSKKEEEAMAIAVDKSIKYMSE